MSPPGSNQAFFAKLLGVALLLATVCNGAEFYLKRVGLIEKEAYGAYWAAHCESLVAIGPGEIAQPRCCALATAGEWPNLLTPEHLMIESARTRYLYNTLGPGIALKIAKDGLFLALIAASAYLIAVGAAALPSARQAWPMYFISSYALIALVASLTYNGVLVAGAGARSFMYLGVALLGQWLAPHLPTIARCLAFLLVAEAALIPYEIMEGIHLHDHIGTIPLAARASGTLVLPNTMGAFAVSSLAFYYSFSSDPRWRWALVVVALALVFASGSGTGIVCMGAFIFVLLLERESGPRQRTVVLACAVAGAALVLALPTLSGRPVIFDSIFGRIYGLLGVVSKLSLPEIILGSGLGVKTNLAAILFGQLGPDAFGAGAQLDFRPSESTITGLLLQIGVMGTLLFYGILIWAGLKDRAARMFYFIVAICSLTLKVNELFPLNLLLGLALAHSMQNHRNTR